MPVNLLKNSKTEHLRTFFLLTVLKDDPESCLGHIDHILKTHKTLSLNGSFADCSLQETLFHQQIHNRYYCEEPLKHHICASLVFVGNISKH